MFTTSESLLQRLHDPSDTEAWPRFVHFYTPLFLSWAQRLPLSGAEADDLVQEIFRKLIPVLPHFEYDKKKSFRAYLQTVCTNCWRDHARKRSNRLFQATDDQLAKLPDGKEGEEEFWSRDYHLWLISQALKFVAEKCDPKTQTIVRQVVLGGRPIKEVAPELDLSENAVAIRIHRVLRQLRRELKHLADE